MMTVMISLIFPPDSYTINHSILPARYIFKYISHTWLNLG